MSKTYAYHNTFGFGEILNCDKSFVNVKFLNNKTRKIVNDKKFINIVDERIINFIQSDDCFSLFSDVTISRANDYFKKNKVTKIEYSNDAIIAQVKGTDTYKVAVECSDNSVSAICDCPVSFNCKHIAATYLKMRSTFETLANLPKEKINNEKKEISNNNIELYEKVKDFIFDQNSDFFSVIDITDSILKLKKIEDIEDLIKKLKDDYLYNDFSKYLIYNDELNSIFFKRSSNSSVYKEYTKQYKEYKYLLNRFDQVYFNKNQTKDIILYLIINKRFDDLIEACFQYNDNKEIISLSSKLAPIIKKYNALDDYTIENLFHYIEYYNISPKMHDFILEICNDEQKEILYSTYPNYFTYSFSDIEKMEESKFISAIPSFKLDMKLIDYLRDNIELFYSKYNNDFIISLENLFFNNTHRVLRDEVVKLFIKIKNTKYLIKYLYYYISYETIRVESDNVLEEEFFSFFIPSYDLKVFNNSMTINYMLSLHNGNIIISCDLDENFNIKENINPNQDFYFEFFLNFMNKNYRSVIEKQYEKEFEQIRLYNYEKNRKRILKAINNFDNSIVNYSTNVFSNNNKVKLEVSFTNKSDDIYMSFKIGNNKMYVGKGSYEILKNFYNENNYKYGKGLEFVHIVKNLVSPYDELMDYLLSFPIEIYYDYYSKDIKLKGKMIINILDILVGHTVFFNDKSYLISDSSFDLKFYIDENYTFLSSIKERFLLVQNYIINFDDGMIRYKALDQREKQLVILYKSNYSSSIQSCKEEFRDQIYSRCSDLFEISDAVKSDFTLSELEINIYFDYNNKKITYKIDLYKQGNPIKNLNSIDKNKVDLLKNYLISLGFDDGVSLTDDAVYNFFNLDFSEMKKLCNVYLSESIQRKMILKLNAPMVKLDYSYGMTNVFFEETGFSDEELEKIIKAIRHKKKYIFLSDDKIVDLDDENSEKLYNIVSDLKLDEKRLNSVQQIPIYQSLKSYVYSENIKLDDYLSNMITDISNFKDLKIDVPKLNAKLREYQKEGLNWLYTLKKYHVGGILADDMGLGKTIQIISLIAKDETNKPSLIVCPKSLVFNWSNEFFRFYPDICVKKIYGNASEREKMIYSIKNDKIVYITSYDSLRSDIDFYKNKNFSNIILDEAQYIKNSQAAKTQSVKMLSGDNKFALTGTPIENNILDLWSIFDFIMPGYFDDISTFKSNYNTEDYQTLIKKKISPFILRRTKENVLKDLPNKYERIISAEMGREQKKIYEAHKKIARDALEDGAKSFDILPLLTRLRQICVAPEMFLENYEGQSCKLDLLYETIDEYINNKHKILIFSQFVKCLNIIENYLRKRGISYYMITGETDALKRIQYANEFNNNDVSIFLISLKAGGTGLNLIGADTVIHMDPWWNVAIENQATDRAHRIGQKKNVEIIKFICMDSIEERVIELQNLKKDVINKFISNDESSIQNISKEDFYYILK